MRVHQQCKPFFHDNKRLAFRGLRFLSPQVEALDILLTRSGVDIRQLVTPQP
jgi:hypothetical protein